MTGWSLTLSFFGASVTLARQPECQTNQQTNPSEADLSAPAIAPALKSRDASPSHESGKSGSRPWANQNRLPSNYRSRRRPSWRRLLKRGV